MKKTTKGFTLIELLVVIAIIGILSSVVLASLNTARAKGADAAIKSGLANMRAQAQLYYDGAGAQTFGPAGNLVCTAGVFTDPTITAAIASINGASGSVVACRSDINSWAMQSPLKAVAGTYWCVDSGGSSKQEGAALGAASTSLCT